MRRFVTTNSFVAVAAGQTATLDLPTGPVYHGLQLSYATGTAGGATAANIADEVTAVRIMVNGKVQRRFSGRDLIAINAYHGRPFREGILPIYFAEPWRRSIQGEDALAWGTADVDTLQVEVDLGDAATNPKLSCRVTKDDVRRPMGPIVKWRKYQVPITVAGVNTITNLPRTDPYFALHCDSDEIKSLAVKVDQTDVLDGTRAQLHGEAIDFGAKVPQADWTHIDFARTNRVADTQNMVDAAGMAVRELRFDFDMAAANSFDVVAEILGLRD